ncbi:PAAR domain-containing protein [Citrobacter sp. Cpo040]|uniref:PAAR domain-containing protein n=1 Tax=Citrobacter TaxID=544 RepID=UPI002578C806|nr:PAAR domain-containing protein [Citrobacter sp. Cpo040]MDM2877939.1 PAAR domain-containing protein [Citrobacter sp. Cpo040]
MGIAYFLRVGDKTTCGGTILTGCTNHILDGQPTARHGDSYICGKDKKLYHIVGGQPGYFIHGVQAAGTAHSVGTCPCKCRFINSISNVTYFYESEVLSAPKSVTNRVVSVAPQNAPKPLTMAPGPYCPGEEDKPPREPVDGGFCVLPYESKPSTYEPYIFVNPPEGTRELYHKLNPDMKKQPGSILIVVDPEKQDQQQIETLQKARDRIDKALAPLTLQDAKLLHDNRGAVDAFSYQLFGDYLGNAGDGFGYISEIGKSYYGEIKQILIEIQELYKDTYSHNKGIISGEEFFGQRARLFKNLDAVLNKFSKTQLNLEEYDSIKKALGLSTSSIMYKWDKTGIDNIEGYATYIERSAKLMNLMKTVGFVGIGLDFSGYTSNVYDACSKGRESACKKAAITEYSKFGFKQASSMLTGLAVGRGANVVCTWILGLSTIEAGGVGAALCFATGVGVTIASSKLVEKYGENAGEYLGGHIIYENFFNSK